MELKTILRIIDCIFIETYLLFYKCLNCMPFYLSDSNDQTIMKKVGTDNWYKWFNVSSHKCEIKHVNLYIYIDMDDIPSPWTWN